MSVGEAGATARRLGAVAADAQPGLARQAPGGGPRAGGGLHERLGLGQVPGCERVAHAPGRRGLRARRGDVAAQATAPRPPPVGTGTRSSASEASMVRSASAP